MGLSRANLALLQISRARAEKLLETDPILRRSMPSLELFKRAIDARTSIEIVERTFETYADRPAVGTCKTGDTITYRALWQRVVRVASGLKRRGVRRGDIAILVGFSTVDHVVAELACHYLAVTSVPLAKNVDVRELELIARETESRVLFCTTERLPITVPFELVIPMDPGLDAIEDSAPISPELPDERTLLSLVYTSGSTGTPKGAMFDERSWHARWSGLPFLELTTLPMVSVVFLPQNHMGGRNAVANSLKLGGLAYFTQQSDMSTLFDDIRLARPTYLHLVPRLSETIYQHYQSELARRPDDDLITEMRESFLGDRILLALTASAPTPPEVSAFIKRCFEIPIVDVFAGTEYGQIFIDGRLNRTNVLEHKLVDVPELGYFSSDRPHPRGELYVRTARAIASYFKNEKATRDLFTEDGFMRTGDIFEERGPDEMLWIDRKNNVLKLAQGEFVNIWKLEARFSTGSRFIEQIYLQGNSTRSYLLAVIVPNLAEIGERDVRATIRAELQRLSRDLQPYETPRDFIIETEPFSRDNGLLTSLNKPSRPNLKKKYGPAIDRLYDELDARATQSATSVQATIAAILGLTELEPSQSFRNYGGDSIAATNLCGRLERDFGVRISVGFVLGPRTSLADIAHEVEAQRDRPTAFGAIHGARPEVIAERELRLDRFFPKIAAPSTPETNTILLTGATGFLGRFLCLSLLERGMKVHCVVRAKSDADAQRRLAEVYGSSDLRARFESLRDRLQVHAGDLEKPFLFDDRIDTVLHAAALVNHALPYQQLFDANVLATAELMRFSLEHGVKRFNFISTNGVSLALLGDRELARETDDTRALGDRWPISSRHADGYRLSKWAGEVLAQDLAESYGVSVNVFRCNLIMPPARYRGQINDDFLTRLIRSVVATKIAPRSFYQGSKRPHLDGFPVDFTASAIAGIATEPSRGYAVYHVNNVQYGGVSLDSIVDRLPGITRIDDHAEWFARFERALRELDIESSLPIIDQWRTPLSTDQRQRIDATNFCAKAGELPHLDDHYLDRIIDDITSR